MASVRRVEPGDAAQFKAVRLAALDDAPSAFGSTYAAEAAATDDAWADRALAGSSGSLRATFFAVEQGAIVGLAGGYRDDPSDTEVHLVSMWVAPAHRRDGVGRALVDEVMAWARATGAYTIALWVTRGNTAAEQLYHSMGFTPTGESQPLPSDPSRAEDRMVRPLP